MKRTAKIVLVAFGVLSSLAVAAKDMAADSAVVTACSLPTGSFLQIGGGIGVSELNYTLAGGTIAPQFPSFTANVGYAYYFLPYMGIGVGVGVSNYGTAATFTESQAWSGLTDEFGDEYEHRTDIVAWREKQQSYLLEVPVALRFRHNFGRRVGLFVHLGAKFVMPVYSTRKLTDATISHKGFPIGTSCFTIYRVVSKPKRLPKQHTKPSSLPDIMPPFLPKWA